MRSSVVESVLNRRLTNQTTAQSLFNVYTELFCFPPSVCLLFYIQSVVSAPVFNYDLQKEPMRYYWYKKMHKSDGCIQCHIWLANRPVLQSETGLLRAQLSESLCP